MRIIRKCVNQTQQVCALKCSGGRLKWTASGSGRFGMYLTAGGVTSVLVTDDTYQVEVRRLINNVAEGTSADMPLEERFGFGQNWMSYIELLDEERINRAQETLQGMLGISTLTGLKFLDIGCGSGLFSLAAKRLGATVTSLDFDPNSVRCAEMLRERWFPGDAQWVVRQGSVLDGKMLESLGSFDIVYSWGVLHHTGQMWNAIANASSRVKPGGSFFIAIYNDQGRTSRQWLKVKKRYNRSSNLGKRWMVYRYIIQFWWKTVLRDTVRYKNPLFSWRNYRSERGMDVVHDMVDWIGGYPFEVAKPEEITDFCLSRGFALRKLKTCGGGLGCNEFVFLKSAT